MRLRMLLATAAALLAGGVLAEQAAACSCGGGKPRAMFRWADAGVEARLISVDPLRRAGGGVGPGRAEFRYELLNVYKGRRRLDRSDELVIESSRSEASCGLPSQEGRRYGLFLYRGDGRWNANLCTVIEAWRMRRAGERFLEDREDRAAQRNRRTAPPPCALAGTA